MVVSQSPSLIDVAGVPWLAWTQDEPGTPGRPVRRVYVVRLADSGGAWEPVGPALNRSETESADAPALLAAGGGAYIAWSEDTEGLMAPYSVIRVASFDPCACSGWREIGDGVPASGGSSATHPSLASVGGRLFVAWELTESYSPYSELLDVRVGVLGADGGTWEILTPRGLDTHQIDHEGRPTLAEIGGRLHLAWSMRGGAHVARLDGDGVTFERLPGPNRAAGSDLALAGVNGAPWIALPRQAAVERLEPDLLAATVSTTTSTASLTGEVNTYGMPVEIGFEYGDEGQTTALLPESGHIARTITGLAPGTTYSYRLHARWGDTVPAGRSDSHQLVTKPAGGVAQPGEPEPTEPTDSTEPTGMPPEGNAAPVLPPGPATPPAAAAAAPVLGSPALRLTTIRRPRASLDRSRLTMVRGRRLRIRYRIATAGTVALRIMRGGHEWDLDGDGTFETDGGSVPTITLTRDQAGTVTPGVRVTDSVGLTDIATFLVVFTPRPPTTTPGVTINGQAAFTTSPNVTLSVVWPAGTTELVVSNDGSFATSSTFPVAPTIPWQLISTGPERLPKTVYVRFRGPAAGAETYQDDILLDQTAPELLSLALSPAPARAGRYVLRTRARDAGSGVVHVQLREAAALTPFGEVRYGTRPLLRMASPKLLVRVGDRAGNFSPWRQVTSPTPASLLARALTARRGRRLVVRYRFDGPGKAMLRIMRGGRTLGYSAQTHKRAGRAYFKWNGRFGRTPAARGRYTVRLEFTANGRTSTDSARLSVR